jgi:fibronectin type 3 domain-containing protein
VVGTRSVVLAWDPSTSSSVIGYHIYRATAPGGPYTKLTVTTVPGTSYADTTVQRGGTYYYVATTVSDSSESTYSNEAQVSVPNP